MTSQPDSLDLDEFDIDDPGPGPDPSSLNTDPSQGPAIKMVFRRQGNTGDWTTPDLITSDEEMDEDEEDEDEAEAGTWEDMDITTEPTIGDILGKLVDKPETQFQDPIKSYHSHGGRAFLVSDNLSL